MTSPKATARGLWLLSNNTYTYQEFDSVTCWIRTCQESLTFIRVIAAKLNDKAQALESPIEFLEIERFLQVDI